MLAPFRQAEFRYFWFGLTAANVGLWMQSFALGWVAVQLAVRDGDPGRAALYLGLRSVASVAPAFVFGVIAGTIADRADRRRTLLWSRVTSGATAVGLALLALTDAMSIGVLMVSSALIWAAFAFDPPTRYALLADVVPPNELFRALGVSRTAIQLSQSLGPFIGGLLILSVDVGGVLVVTALLNLVSIALLLRMRAYPPPPGAAGQSVLGATGEGVSYVGRTPVLRWVMLVNVLIGIAVLPIVWLMPAFAVEVLRVGVLELSWLTTAFGVGSLAGAVTAGVIGDIGRRGLLMAGALLGVGVLTGILGLLGGLWPALVALAVLGLIQQILLNATTVTLSLESAPAFRGRVLGMQNLTYNTLMPLGVLGLGVLGTLFGLSGVLVGAGLGIVLAGIGFLGVPAIRHLRGGAIH